MLSNLVNEYFQYQSRQNHWLRLTGIERRMRERSWLLTPESRAITALTILIYRGDQPKELCQVQDCFRTQYEQIDREQRVPVEDCDQEDACSCSKHQVARLKTHNLWLNSFRQLMIDQFDQFNQFNQFDQQMVLKLSKTPRDCQICFEKSDKIVIDREKHYRLHPTCLSCFIQHGSFICPSCRHRLSFLDESINQYLQQMTEINRTIIQNDSIIEYIEETIHEDV